VKSQLFHLTMRQILTVMSLVAIFGVHAKAEQFCKLSPTVTSPDGKVLELLGAGVRTYWLRKTNAVALYTSVEVKKWADVERSPAPIQADVVFFINFSKQQLQDSWRERLTVITDAASRARYDDSIRAFLAILRDVRRGDRLSFSVSNVGLTLSLNDRVIGSAGDLAFGKLVISSWFGENPASAELKEAVFARKRVEELPCRM
jgi:hypothetical protein